MHTSVHTHIRSFFQGKWDNRDDNAIEEDLPINISVLWCQEERKKGANIGENSTRHCKNDKPITRPVFETQGWLTAVEDACDHCRWQVD